MFCGMTAAQIRIHFTKENEGSTHVHECPKFPPEINKFYRDVRDAFVLAPSQPFIKHLYAKIYVCFSDFLSWMLANQVISM